MPHVDATEFLRILNEFAESHYWDAADERLFDHRLDALGFESLELIEVLARIETWYGIRLSDAALVRAHTLRELLAAIRAAQAELAGRAYSCASW